MLRAIVEACGTNATLDKLWRGQMPIVTSLTWLSRRVYYLAATRTRPFSDEQVVIDVLADAWALALYGRRADNAHPE